MKEAIGSLVYILTIFFAIYVGSWLMFIKPIIFVCLAIDAGTLTGMLVGTCIVKVLLSSTVTKLILEFGVEIMKSLLEN